MEINPQITLPGGIPVVSTAPRLPSAENPSEPLSEATYPKYLAYAVHLWHNGLPQESFWLFSKLLRFSEANGHTHRQDKIHAFLAGQFILKHDYSRALTHALKVSDASSTRKHIVIEQLLAILGTSPDLASIQELAIRLGGKENEAIANLYAGNLQAALEGLRTLPGPYAPAFREKIGKLLDLQR